MKNYQIILFYKKNKSREKLNYIFIKNILEFSQKKILENKSEELIKFSLEQKFFDIINTNSICDESEDFKKLTVEVFKGYPKKISIKWSKLPQI